jgi:AcrR family transcriptional regulator
MKDLTQTTRGEETRAHILKAALRQASSTGFGALTIGSLATQTGMSKSGLFAHFGSKEELQIATLDESVRRFEETAMIPALAAPRGLKRLTAIFNNWLTWTARNELSTCPLMAASLEFGDRPGAVRDAMLAHTKRMHEGLVKATRMTIDSGEFAPQTDPEQFAFELYCIITGLYRQRHLFPDKILSQRAKKAFERLVASALTPPPAAKKRSSRK